MFRSIMFSILAFFSLSAYSVSVISYGADPTGTTDSTSAIQAAVNAADEVYFPAGTYLCNSRIYLDNKSYLYGDGFASIIKQGGATTVMQANTSSTGTYIEDITIRNLKFLGKAATNGFSEFVHLIKFSGVRNVLVDNCFFEGFQGDGISIGGVNNSMDECHNENIRIINCTFDGINNDNRNGISIVDGAYVMISKCSFFNCSRSNMPGCIDIEPNADTFAIIKNITVNNCVFEGCNGGVGNICLVITTNFTVKPTGFVFTNNTFHSNNGISVVSNASNETHNHNIVISGNVCYELSRPFSFTPSSSSAINGISISNNIFQHSNAGLLGFDAAAKVNNLSMTGNIFNANEATGAVVIRSGSNMIISNNVFNDYSSSAISCGTSGSTLSSISIIGNVFNNMGSNAVTMAATTTNPSTNIFYNNQLNGASHNFKAFRTDDNSNVWNGTTAVTFNTSTLPDSFPMGISTATINGDTGVPSGLGGYQGVLTTYRLSTIAKATYQTFHHANNTLKLGSFWLRRRNQTTNSWTRWYEVQGI